MKKFKGKRLAGETQALKSRDQNMELEISQKEVSSLKRPNQSQVVTRSR